MNRGSINSSLKKGTSGEIITNKQVSYAYEQSRKKREIYIRQKRGRVESPSPTESKSSQLSDADPSKLQEYAVSVLTEDPISVNEAARQIRRLLSKDDGFYVNDVISTGVVPSFVKFLSLDTQPRLQFESVWALTNIASGTPEQTRAVVNAGAIPPILRLLSSQQLENQEQAVWALANIAGDCSDYRMCILQLNGFSLVIELAKKNIERIGLIKNCIWCLSNLCRNHDRIQGQFDYIRPHLPYLSQLLQYNQVEVVADACWAFSFLTDAEAAQKKAVIEYIPQKYLIRLILYNEIHLQCPALRIAGNIVAGDVDDTQVMLDAGLLEALIELLKTSCESQKREILWIISNITAGPPQHIQMVIDTDLITYLINVINTDVVPMQIHAVWAVCNAINSGKGEQIRYIIEKQVVAPLVHMLTPTPSNQLLKNILISISRILKIGLHIQKHCQLRENPYCSLVSEAGGVDRVCEIEQDSSPDIRDICERILQFCDTDKSNDDEMLSNI